MLENFCRRLSAKTHFWDDDVEALVATIMRDVVPGWQLINIISISSIIFLRTNSLAFAFSEEEKLKKVSCPKALPFLGSKVSTVCA